MWTLCLRTFHATYICLWSVHIYPRNKIVAMTYAPTHVYTEWKGNECHPFNSRRGRLKGPKILYTGWKENKCHPFNSRRGRLKDNIHTIWGVNLIVFSEKWYFFFRFVLLLISSEIMRKKFKSAGLSYKDVILFLKYFMCSM